MMKLNNHGWGLREMLLYCGILLLFLCIAVFFIIQASKGLEDIGESNNAIVEEEVSYSEIEENVKDASLLYVDAYYEEGIKTGTITITTDNLKKFNMLSIDDLIPVGEKNSCNGYSLVKNEDNSLVVSAYIKCSNYETNGYQSWRLGE